MRRAFKLAAALAIVLGLTVLAGWGTGAEAIKSVLPGEVSMKANTALCIVLLGVALLALGSGHPRGSGALAALAAGIGALTLAEYAFGWNAGIDELLFSEQDDAVGTSAPGRMAPNAATTFVLLGGAVLLARAGGWRASAGRFLAGAAGVVGMLALVGYVTETPSLFGLGTLTRMALHTAIGVLLLVAAFFLAEPERGLMATVSSDGVEGVVARRVLPAALLGPIAAGLLGHVTIELHLFTERAAAWVTIVVIAVLFTALAVSVVRYLARSEAQRAREEAQRRGLERDIQRFFSLSHDMLCTANADGHFILLNPAWERVLGYSSAELRERPFIEFVHPEDRERTAAEASRLFGGETSIDFVNRYRTKSGAWRALEWRAMLGDDERTIYARAMDVTARQRRQRYRELEHRATQVLAAADGLDGLGESLLPIVASEGWPAVALWWASPDGSQLRCAEAWTTDGAHAPVRSGDSCDLKTVAGDIPRSLRSNTEVEVRQIPAGSEAYAAGYRAVLWVPILTDGEPAGGLQLFDRRSREHDVEFEDTLAAIAARIGQFVEREHARAELERAKREFFGLVSHELRTPLTSIIGYTELLGERESERLSASGREFVEVIDRNARRELRLVQDLLLLIRLEGGTFTIEPSVIDLAVVVRDAAEQVRTRADQAGVELSVELDPIPDCEGDRQRLSQVFDNLLTNAIKFTPAGGSVAVRLRQEAAGAVVEVSDTGIGIPREELPRLFEHLYRTSLSQRMQIPGTGLGLSVVKAVVEAHGGRIYVSSSEGEGTVVRVDLPLTPVAPPDEATVTTRTASAAGVADGG